MRLRFDPRERFATTLALGAATLLASLAIAPAARAESLYGNRETFWQGQIGMRSSFVTDPSFDPFADSNALTSFSLGASRTIFDQDAFSLAPGIFWDYGARSSTARGQATSLQAHRVALALEGRYHIAPWVYGLVRLTPGAIHQSAQIDDPLSPAPFVAKAWTFAFDASAGAAFLLGPHSAPSLVHWWLAAEGGYGYAGSASLMMHSDLAADDPRRTGDINLGQLALSGAFVRIYGSVTF